MKDYGQLITKIQDSPWLITEGGLRMILQIVDNHIEGKITLEEIRARTEGGKRERGSKPKQDGAVGLLPLHGPIFPRANLMTELSGATSIEQWQQDFRALLSNDRVSSILLDIDSPGGSSAMIEEMANEIREGRATKPIYAVANTMAGSAAYWLASQASELYVTDSGFVGSVGAYLVHTDKSELDSKVGVKTTIISEGRFKAALINPLTDDTSGYLQGIVKDSYDAFVNGVAEGRNTTTQDVVDNFGEGGVVGAKKALESGMVDGVRTFDDVLTSLLDNGGTLVTAGSGTSSSGGFELKASEKEMEHSEPGTGSPPQPRTPPPDEKKDDWRNGARFDPPVEPEESMNREQLIELATKLGIQNAGDLKDDELFAKVSEASLSLHEENKEIREATAVAAKELDFAKKYPEQADELRMLKQKNSESEARLYAGNFERIKDNEGNDTKFGLSVLARDLIQDTHLKMKQGNLLEDDLTTLIHTVGRSVVKYEEEGSSRSREATAIPATRGAVRQLMADKVKTVMTEDGLDRNAAIAEVSKRDPELAQAYRES